MSKRVQHGWGGFPSSKMTTVYRTFRCRNCTRITILIAARPRQPSTRHLCGPPAVRKAIQCGCGSSPGSMAAQICLPSAAPPYFVYMFPASNPCAISAPYSLHWNLPLFCPRYEGSSPVIRLPYVTSDCVPATWHRRQTMPTVFPKLFRRPTLSNRPIKVLKVPWSHHRSDDATIPSSV